MFGFGEKRPVLFEIILFIAALLAAAAFTVAGNIFYLPADLSSSVGRIAVGIALLIIYKRAFKGGRALGNPVYALPALLFAAWNLFYNLSSGMELGGLPFYTEALITALAPAVFEEVLFRGIFIYNLKRKGHGDLKCLLISALVFAAVHLTNIVGLDLASVALQLVYSFVVGLVFGAVYLKNRSILQVIFAHFLTDFTNRIFVEQASSTTTFQLIVFAAVLAVGTVYALWLTGKKK